MINLIPRFYDVTEGTITLDGKDIRTISQHDLRDEIAYGKENRHYRLRNYLSRNCENYPTHDLGPIAKILNINHGNRMLTLSSFASKSAGLHEFIMQNKSDDERLKQAHFARVISSPQ